MGSPPRDPDRTDGEGYTDVTLSRGFWIGKYEVTQGQWDSLMEETMQQRVERTGLGRESGIGPEYPFFVSNPADADAFCLKLTAAERAAGRLPEGWIYGLFPPKHSGSMPVAPGRPRPPPSATS
jgi:formylglycine-generating enzyme required for sulfatase activity